MKKTMEKPSLVAVGHNEVSVTEAGSGLYTLAINAGGHILCADEPENAGGQNKGPAPYELLLSALGACTTITLRMYAERKGWDLKDIHVELSYRKEETASGKLDEITKKITLEGDLSDEQQARLLEIAEKCPVNQTLHSKISFV